ncbi:polyketide synthase dehydratase domain-containing protein, partial [Streptomyces sp. NPDC005963]|uniref:polyketide synthase dehydratase domain-containing protein n=1 Tax=Streptomyces sp. NPDC005963 TaxID=3156721 RepID=UPI0033DA2989
LHRKHPTLKHFHTNLAHHHTHGTPTTWTHTPGQTPTQTPTEKPQHHTPLPTYPFQHNTYWLHPTNPTTTPPGHTPTHHPLLTTTLQLANHHEQLLTGQINLKNHPWLNDHTVHGTPLLPGTAFIELALHAADRLNNATVEELTLEAPLRLPPDQPVQIQVLVGAPDPAADGRRTVAIHSCAANASDEETPWTRHAVGTLITADVAPGQQPAQGTESGLTVWPPAGAAPVDLVSFYPELAESGLEYGPAFQGLHKAWRLGDDVYAEVALPEDQHGNADHFRIHPALLDAALHAGVLGRSADDARLPFAWTGVTLHATGATSLRVRVTPLSPDAVSVTVADPTGATVATVESLVSRPAPALSAEASSGVPSDELYEIAWAEIGRGQAAPAGLTVLIGDDVFGVADGLRSAGTVVQESLDMDGAAEGSDGVPDLVVVSCSAEVTIVDSASAAECLRSATARGLETVQQWLADDRFAASRLVLLTRGAVAVLPGEDVVDALQSPLWGLVRSAQSEHPERFVLADVDRDPECGTALAAALAADEPQIAVRKGATYVPRLARPVPGLVVPGEGPWRLDVTERGTLENLALVSAPEAAEPLTDGQIRISVRSAGLNFRDVLITLGMYPGDAIMGGEGAGVVTEVGPGVSGLTVGDRVLGLMPGGFGPTVVVDHRLVARVPEGWSFARAASVPVVFLTAYYALVDIARAQPGERVLIHAAAGGVGMAAVQLAH